MALISKITCSKVENKRQVVEHFYYMESDQWHRLVHENGGSAKDNVESTLRTISEESDMYEVDVNGELAAFFVRYENAYGALALEGFHVGSEFRNINFLMRFWEVVRKAFGKDFHVGVYAQNKPAIEHLIRQGFSIERKIELDNKPVFILKS
jgi:hypothetical protein